MESQQASFSDMVKEFHEKQGIRTIDFFDEADDCKVLERIAVMSEEFHEVLKALAYSDTPEIAHELADLIYTVVGTAICYGIEIEPVFAEIHRCNMLKGPGFDKANYTKPEIKV